MDLQSLKIDRKPKAPPRARRSRRLPLGALALLALAGLALWVAWPAVQRQVDALRLPAVRTLVVTESAPAAAAAAAGTAANGYIVAARRAALSTDVPGRIVEMRVTEGSVVRKGEVVARLYSDEYRAALERAEADVAAADAAVRRAASAEEQARAAGREAAAEVATRTAQVAEARASQRFAAAEYDRVAALVRDGVLSTKDEERARSELDTAAARVTAAEAAAQGAEAAAATAAVRVEVAAGDHAVAKAQREVAAAAAREARAALEKTDVRAPFDGIVVLKDAEVGEVVSPNVMGGTTARGAVCTMVDFDSLEVQAELPQTSLVNVRVGAPADVYLDAFPEHRYPGRVDRIWPTADRQKGTIEVRVELLQRDDRLRPEMGARIVFRKDEAEPAAEAPAADGAPAPQPAILVPEAAIVQIAGRDGAFVLERDRVRFQEVRLGARRAGRVVVAAGLRPGQRIVDAPPPSLQDGERVRVETQG